MNKILILIGALLLCGCADYSVNARVDGVSKPSDLEPKPFPDAPPNSNN
jgi:hypothetical protein